MPLLLQRLLPQFTWRVNTPGHTIYLTFDDGPIPDVTEFVLDELQRFEAKATFFCVGENISKHPAIARRVAAEGHRLGNHTYNHLPGWQTELNRYTGNVALCRQKIEEVAGKDDRPMLFRPPYGKISRKQTRKLKTDYELVLWDVLSYDFDATLHPEQCLHRCLSLTTPGSIVVFHDNIKAMRILQYVLPRFLERFAGKGYNFAAL